MNNLKLLAVFAHPDDESMGMGGTLAKYAAEGVETYLICATRGEQGWFGPEEENPDQAELGELRANELKCAASVLGVREIAFLDYIDGRVDNAKPSEIIGKIASHVRDIQPQVVVTFPPDGNYGHPDHIAIGQFTCAALMCAADASYVDPAHLPAHRVSKLYYMVDSENFVNFIAPFIGDMTFAVDDQLREETPWKEWMITTRVDMTDYCHIALQAIQCHQSQLATLGPLADAEDETSHQILALQGSFYRAFSSVNGGREIETDLFAGLR